MALIRELHQTHAQKRRHSQIERTDECVEKLVNLLFLCGLVRQVHGHAVVNFLHQLVSGHLE